MALTPRKAEVDSVVEILEQEHDSPEALAKTLLKHFYTLANDREWFSVHHQPWPENPNPLTFSFGPFATQGDAKRALKHLNGGRAMVLTLLTVNSMETSVVTESKHVCSTCKHPDHAHHNSKRFCCVKTCKCQALVTD